MNMYIFTLPAQPQSKCLLLAAAILCKKNRPIDPKMWPYKNLVKFITRIILL
jgi:hypothetical protein